MEAAVYEREQSHYTAEDAADLFILMDSFEAISREAAENACEENMLREEDNTYRNIYLLSRSIISAGIPSDREYMLGVYRSNEYRYTVFIRVMEDEEGEGLTYKTRVRRSRLARRRKKEKRNLND